MTFHLPDGSQESCSDSGLGDPEPSSTASTGQTLPLSFPQEEYYEQTSPNSRTEGDGNSDPESSECRSPLCSDRGETSSFLFVVGSVFTELLRLSWMAFRRRVVDDMRVYVEVGQQGRTERDWNAARE